MILSSVSFVVFVDSSLRQISIIPSFFLPITKAYVPLKLFQGYSILTLHMLPNQTGILGGETILLDHDLHVCEPIYM